MKYSPIIRYETMFPRQVHYLFNTNDIKKWTIPTIKKETQPIIG